MCACGARGGSVGPVYAPDSPLGGLVRPPNLDDPRWCVRSGHLAPIRSTSFIRLAGVAIVINRKMASS